ncbi:MAG: 1-acyl-sn-glycerol-3-phosphate acyltransferase [Tannerellaceae bacterium]|nr:1-acyl-sn-glycerol-3-phosphate acyltransferase [Tannerellaceae bacterium]
MTRFVLFLYSRLARRKWLAAVSLAGFAVFFTVALLRLEYREDVGEFLPDSEANDKINAFYRHIGSSNRLLVFFSMKDTALTDRDRITAAVDMFAATLAGRDTTGIAASVNARSDDSEALGLASFVINNAPYFMDDDDYARIDSLLADSLAAGRRLHEARQLLALPTGVAMRDALPADPLGLFTPLVEKLRGFEAGGGYEVYNGYHFMGGGSKAVVYLDTPYGVSETKQNTALLRMIEDVMDTVRAEHPDMRITCFGTPAIAVSNASQIKKDSLVSSALAVVLILLLLVYCFRRARNIFLIFAPVAFGWLFAMAVLSAFMGSVSVIVIGISSIVIGIAVNYPLHLIDHLRHERDIRRALRDVTPPLLIGNITTVGAFLSLAFIDSSAMRNLGLFASLLLAGAIGFVLVYLPHFVKAGVDGGSPRGDIPLLGRLSRFAPERRRWIVLAAVALTIIFGWFSRYTYFEADANKINYLAPEQEEDMADTYSSIEREGRDIVYMISEGDSLDEALRVREAGLPLVDSVLHTGLASEVAGVGRFLPSREEQEARINRWNGFWELRRAGVINRVEGAAAKEGFRAGAFARFTDIIGSDFSPRGEDAFAPITDLLAGHYLLEDNGRNMVVTLLYCKQGESAGLIDALRGGPAGSFAFDSRNAMERMVDSLSDDFNYVLYISGFIVFAFLLLSFGRIELGLLAFLPLTVSWIWILGIMGLGGMSFNIVNIILATFIFGQGDDYTIFITEGLIHEYTYRKKMLASYKSSIILSALIMFTGMGMLIFAKHPALRSLAEVTVVGMISVTLMAYIIPPLIFRALTQSGGKFREVPVTLRRLGVSVVAFTVFLLLTAFITLYGRILLGGRRSTELNRLRYHRLLSGISGFVIRRMPGVKFLYENLYGENFERPAVVVANHQSHLDLMCILMLTPRLVVLTNERVWNNPFYGRLIRYADFYPASAGIDPIIEQLSDRVRNGYSVLVFPEGTRSENCASIMRFHQGAFYLADRLGLDVVPVLIHGAGHVLPKKDFMLRWGCITVQVHRRMSSNGLSCLAWAKQTRRYCAERYEALMRRRETAAYFTPFVIHNYIYKGIGIEYGVRRELRRNKSYSAVIDGWTATSGRVLAVNGGAGAFAFLFALTHRGATVVSVDADPVNTSIAGNCAGLPPNVSFCNESDLPAGESFDYVFLINPTESQRAAWPDGCIINNGHE